MGLRVLITGANGKLGGHILKSLKLHGNQVDQIIYTLSRQISSDSRHINVDITQLDVFTNALERINPTHIIHLAAFSNPELVERNQNKAWVTNVGSTIRVADYAEKNGAHLVLASTDFVFGGNLGRCYVESDIAEPQNYYGVTKFEAERIVLNAGGAIARLSMLYGFPVQKHIPTTFSRLLDKIKNGEPVPVLYDEWRTPVRYEDAAEALVNLLQMRLIGLFHIGGPEVMTIEIMMQRCAEFIGKSPSFERLSPKDLGIAARPKYVGLDSGKIRTEMPNLVLSKFYDKSEFFSLVNI